MPSSVSLALFAPHTSVSISPQRTSCNRNGAFIAKSISFISHTACCWRQALNLKCFRVNYLGSFALDAKAQAFNIRMRATAFNSFLIRALTFIRLNRTGVHTRVDVLSVVEIILTTTDYILYNLLFILNEERMLNCLSSLLCPQLREHYL